MAAALLGPALASFAPSILSGLGLFGDPQRDLRNQINRLLAPERQAQMTNQFFQQAQGSPAFQQALGSIATGANAASGRLASNLGARGIGNTGIGAVLSSLGPSLVGSQRAQLNTAAYQRAQHQAQQALQQQIQALMGTSGPSQTRQFAGVGLESFQPILQAYLKAQHPNLFNFGGGG